MYMIDYPSWNTMGTMHTIIGTRDSNSSTFLKLEGGSGLNKKINLIDIKICFSNLVLFRK